MIKRLLTILLKYRNNKTQSMIIKHLNTFAAFIAEVLSLDGINASVPPCKDLETLLDEAYIMMYF